MTADLVAFLRARLDDDERVARAVDSTPWRQGTADRPGWDRNLVYVDGDERVLHDLTEQEAAHVTRHDPARVLAEVAAKHALLDMHTPVPTARALAEGRPYRSCSTCDPYPPMDAPSPGSCATLRLLVRPYAGHPHFHPSWSTE